MYDSLPLLEAAGKLVPRVVPLLRYYLPLPRDVLVLAAYLAFSLAYFNFSLVNFSYTDCSSGIVGLGPEVEDPSRAMSINSAESADSRGKLYLRRSINSYT